MSPCISNITNGENVGIASIFNLEGFSNLDVTTIVDASAGQRLDDLGLWCLSSANDLAQR
jgi:hypothetical protein